MNLIGLSNSVPSVLASPSECPRCRGTARINQSECLSCLLHVALEDGGETGSENLHLLLAEVEVRDTDWRLGNYQFSKRSEAAGWA
jgi:hypothetical protein